MQKLGLSSAELAAYHRALRSSHTRRITIQVTNLDGGVVSTLSNRLLDGEVIVDYDGEVTRSLVLSLLDPHHSLSFDTDSPDDGALYADRMIRVTYSVHVEELGRYISCVVFHGPVTKLDRKNDVVDIEAQGKESLAMGAAWKTLNLKKGEPKSEAIKKILNERAGEDYFAFPSLNTRLPEVISLDATSVPWTVARGIASSMDQQLFYPGNGVCTLRELPNTPVWTFKTGNGGDIVSDVSVSYQMEDIRNIVVVRGPSSKDRVEEHAMAGPQHPLSPTRLGRSGVPRYLVEVIEDDSIRSKSEALSKARRILEDRLREVVEVTCDVIPVPHLDPGDLVRVDNDELTVTFRLKQFTIPLGTDGAPTMSVGYHRKTTINRRRFRR